MPYLSKQQLAEEHEDFKAEQLRAVRTISGEAPEAVLDAATAIKLVSKDTRARIEDALGKEHVQLFEKAYQPPGVVFINEKARQEAFVKAFESVYGKFLFEEEEALDKSSKNKLTSILDKVLRFRMDEEFGLKLRPELQSAVRRLGEISRSPEMATSQISAKEKVLQTLTDNEETTGTNLSNWQNIKKSLEKIKIEKLPAGLENLSSLLTEQTALEEKRESFSNDFNKYFLDVYKMNQDIKDLLETLRELHPNLDVEEIEELQRKLTDFYDNSMNNPEAINPEALEKSLRDELGKVLDNFKSVKGVRMDILIGKAKKSRKTLMKHSKIVKTYKQSLEEIQKKQAEIDGKKEFIREILGAISKLSNVPDEIRNFYDKYNAVQPLDLNAMSADDLRTFATVTSDFLDNVKTPIDGKINEYNGELADIAKNKDLAQRTIDYLKTGAAREKEIQKISGELAEARKTESEITTALTPLNKAYEQFEKLDDIKNKIDKLGKAASPESSRHLDELSSLVDSLENLSSEKIPEIFKDKGISDAYAKCVKVLKWIEGAPSPAPTMLESLVVDLLSLKKLINNAIDEKNTDLTKLQQKITDIQRRESQYADYKTYKFDFDEILGKAFGTIDATAFQNMKRKIKKAEENEGRAEESREYFEGNKLKKLKIAYEQFENSYNGKFVTLEDKDGNERRLSYLNVPLKTTISELEEKVKERRDSRDRKDEKGNYAEIGEKRRTLTNEINAYSKQIEELKMLQTNTKALFEVMKDFVKHLRDLVDLEVFAFTASFKDIKKISLNLDSLQLDSANFRVDDLKIGVLLDLIPYYDNIKQDELMGKFDERIPKLEEITKKAKQDLSKLERTKKENENLTDAQAAKKIISAVIAEQNPDMSPTDKQKLATMILANDVETIQTDKSYAELAERGSAGLFEAVQEVGFKEKLIGFHYKEGEKTVKPFEDLKPEQFSDWANIERLFNIGRLDHQNGFFVLAGMEEFGGKNSIQYIRTERKLKELLAKNMTDANAKKPVDERMDEAGINKIVNEAFTEQLEKARHDVQGYGRQYDANIPKWKENKVKELNLRFQKLKEQRRLGKIEDSVYKFRVEKLLEEARETGVVGEIDFSQNTILTGFWDSPFSQWFRDRGYDVGQYGKNKAKSLGKGAFKAGISGAWKASMWGVGLGLQTALTPIRFTKYPLMVAGKPLIGFINLFRRDKWSPYSIRGAVKKDASRITGYFKGKAVSAWEDSLKSLNAVPEEWGKAAYKGAKYIERTKVDTAAIEEQAEELKEKAEPTPVKIVGSPFIDLDKYKRKIEKLDEDVAGKAAGGETEKKAA